LKQSPDLDGFNADKKKGGLHMKYEAYFTEPGRSFTRHIIGDHEGDLEDILNRLSYEAEDERELMDGVRLTALRESSPTFEVTLMTTDGERIPSFRQEETRADAIKHAIDATTFERGDGLRIATVDIEQVTIMSWTDSRGNLRAEWVLA
jgi:hypothetical protein